MIETTITIAIALIGIIAYLSKEKAKYKKKLIYALTLLILVETGLICADKFISKRYQSLLIYPIVLWSAYGIISLGNLKTITSIFRNKKIYYAVIITSLLLMNIGKIMKPRGYKSYINNLCQTIIYNSKTKAIYQVKNKEEQKRIVYYLDKRKSHYPTQNTIGIDEWKDYDITKFIGDKYEITTSKEYDCEADNEIDRISVFAHYTTSKRNKRIKVELLNDKESGIEEVDNVQKEEGKNLVANPGFELTNKNKVFQEYYNEFFRRLNQNYSNIHQFPQDWILYFKKENDDFPMSLFVTRSKRINGLYSLHMNSNKNRFPAMISTQKIKNGKYCFSMYVKGLFQQNNIITIYFNSKPIVDKKDARIFLIDDTNLYRIRFDVDNTKESDYFCIIIAVDGSVIIDDISLIEQ